MFVFHVDHPPRFRDVRLICLQGRKAGTAEYLPKSKEEQKCNSTS